MKRVLIVEDCIVFRSVLRLFFMPYGYQLDMKGSVEEVDFSICPSLRYDLILSDYNLPGDNGFEFLKKVKAMGQGPIPLILMSANTKVKREHKNWSLIIDDFIPKPFGRKSLIRLLGHLNITEPQPA